MLSAFTKPKTDQEKIDIALIHEEKTYRHELRKRYETGELSLADIDAYSFDLDVSAAFRAAAHDLLTILDRS